MNAEYLNAFCIVAREGSVTAAARILTLSQPAVSRQLRLLQEECGKPLYRRAGAGIELTPAGRELLPYACAVSQALERARQRIAGEIEPASTRLQVALSHHLITRYTASLLRAAKAYDDAGYTLNLHLQEGYTPELLGALRAGRLDSALVLGEPGETADLECTHVGEEQISLLVREDDPLATESGLELGALTGETLVLPSSASIVFERVRSALDASGSRPGRILEVSGPAAVRSAVFAGMGIGVTVGSYIEAGKGDAALRAIGIREQGMVLPVIRIQRNDWFLLPDQVHALNFLADSLGS